MLDRTFVKYINSSTLFMQTISLNFIVPANWTELSDKQLRFVYQLIDDEFNSDKLKTLFLLKWSNLKNGMSARQRFRSYQRSQYPFRADSVDLRRAASAFRLAHFSVDCAWPYLQNQSLRVHS